MFNNTGYLVVIAQVMMDGNVQFFPVVLELHHWVCSPFGLGV